jgi:uncharacterized small protein (DUF1192 family)
VLPADAPDLDVKDVTSVVVLLGRCINEVRKGLIDPKVANATGYLASVLLRALEVGELEQRLAALEAERLERDLAQSQATRPGAAVSTSELAATNGHSPTGNDS